MITAKTALFGVIGDPIRQSLSPEIHNAWFKTANMDAVYSAFHLQSDLADQDIRSLFNLGVEGLNITMPHKRAALDAATDTTPSAKRVGAANTLKRNENGWVAHNTDVGGFYNTLLAALKNKDLNGRHVLVIGAGGAARAVVDALFQAGARLTILNRTVSKAEKLATELAPGSACGCLSDMSLEMEKANIVVNASGIGFFAESDIYFPNGNGRLFYDLSYGKAGEAMLVPARASGWKTVDGLPMLVEQARLAFEIWTGILPPAEDTLAMCRERLAG